MTSPTLSWLRPASIAIFLATSVVPAFAGGYQYFVVGNPGDVAPATTPGLVLAGGGTDVDAAFQWMIARSGGGDFVVLRATGTDAYDPYIDSLGPVDSVETLIVKTRAAANDPFVVAKVRNAEALFIAGGDQRDYIKRWQGTALADAIDFVAAKGAPVGGTSAGLAILGGFVYSAIHNTVYSANALANPFDHRVTLDRDFLTLPGLSDVITDSHFVSRDRMGRLVTFLARIVADGWATQARGIGVDEQTAVLIDAAGTATLQGTGTAYFLQSPGPPAVCQPRQPLTFGPIPVYRLSASDTFDIGTWTPTGGTAYSVSATAGLLSSTQAGGAVY